MSVLKAIIDFLIEFIRLWKNKPIEDSPPVIAAPLLVIPHPEEPPDYTRTVEDIETHIVVAEWLSIYEVPIEFWDYWKFAIDIQVYETYPDYMLAWGVKQDYPSFSWEGNGMRHIAIKPAWLNAGVIAHEQSHNSRALLTETQKSQFASVYHAIKDTDPLIQLLLSIKEHTMYNDVEIHAEIGRFLGQFIPSELRCFYPKLF